MAQNTYDDPDFLAGFTSEHIEEWRPSAQELSTQPALAEELERPMMLLVKASW